MYSIPVDGADGAVGDSPRADHIPRQLVLGQFILCEHSVQNLGLEDQVLVLRHALGHFLNVSVVDAARVDEASPAGALDLDVAGQIFDGEKDSVALGVHQQRGVSQGATDLLVVKHRTSDTYITRGNEQKA